MGMIEKLMGRKARNSGNLAREITAQEAGIAASRSSITAAQAARKEAIENFDDDSHKAADEAAAAARRDIERREIAIETLTAAHEAALDDEAREAFRREDAALAREAEAVADKIKAEYASAASTVAALVGAIETHQVKLERHRARGKELGEPVSCRNAEAFRGLSAKRWSAEWPNPNGDGFISGGVEGAPRGSITWIEGEPASTRADVRVRFRGGGEPPLTLAVAIGNLPGLFVGDAPYHAQRRTEPEVFGDRRA